MVTVPAQGSPVGRHPDLYSTGYRARANKIYVATYYDILNCAAIKGHPCIFLHLQTLPCTAQLQRLGKVFLPRSFREIFLNGLAIAFATASVDEFGSCQGVLLPCLQLMPHLQATQRPQPIWLKRFCRTLRKRAAHTSWSTGFPSARLSSAVSTMVSCASYATPHRQA